MHTIPISLDVLKALTNRLKADDQTYDDVLRELLELDSPVEPEIEPAPFAMFADALTSQFEGLRRVQNGPGFYSRDLFLPNGTELRARYKGRLYEASIQDEKWLDDRGKERSSPSAAAGAITKTIVNGLRFWEGKRPGDSAWLRLDKLR